MSNPVRSARVAWILGALALLLLAWQGHRVAHWLPQLEQTIAGLGAWGPLALILAMLLLAPLLVPDSIFGVAAGATFGLATGSACYLAGGYLTCLAIQAVSRRWLRARILPLLARHPRLLAAAEVAPQGGPRFTFLIRLVPVNQALLSYALGAADVPLRFAVLGNVGMFVHMFPTVYFGAAAVHLTRMAGSGHRAWETEGVLLLLGLAACVLVSVQVTQRAWAAIGASGPPGSALGAVPTSR